MDTRGVSLSFFLEVILADPRFEDSMGTSALKKAIVMPDTAERMCAFIDLYEGKRDSRGRLYVSRATVFVSHAWLYIFSAVPLDVMKTHHQENPDAYFWYDVFINNH